MAQELILIIANTSIAWAFALLFIRRKYTAIAFNALLCGAVHGICCFVLYPVAKEVHLSGIQLLVFLLMTVFVQLKDRDKYGNAVIALCLAQTVYSLFAVIGKNAWKAWGNPGLVLYLGSVGLFVVITYLARARFPTENWQEYYADQTPDPERIHVKRWHIYFVAALGGVLMTASMWLLSDADKNIRLILAAGLFAAFWCETALLIFMQAYKRERLEILLEQQYRDEMQSFMNVIRSQRHDYNFHVQTLAGLLKEGNLAECRRYMEVLEQDSSEMNAVLPVRDPAVSALIHNFRLLAAREGIRLHLDIQNDLTQIATNVYETNKIISNLLQNAIDETRTHSDKSYGIHLTILKRSEYIVIRVSNEFDPARVDAEELSRIYRQGYSTKQGHEGVGLSSLKQLTGRYHGTIYTQMEGNVIHFVAKVPVNFAKKPEGEV